ncbi:MAG: sugar phosphate isomerase/epimerase family protein [Paracoccaceae bacterium]
MISYQLYSSRNFPPMGDTLAMLAGAGYGAVEGYGGLYGDAGALAGLAAGLKASGLTMPSGHFGLAQVEEQPDFVIEIARTLGMSKVYVPYLMAEDRPSDAAGWRAFGARLQAAGAPLRAAGLGFGWHNHDFEFVALADGTIPQVAMFEGGPELEWEIDVAWVVRGGADPLEWITRYASRITAAHVKDIAEVANAEDGWADVGHGVMDWAGLMAALRGVGCGIFVLEHDNPSDHVRFATRSMASMKGY